MFQFANDLVVDGFLHKQSTTGTTNVTLIEVDSVDDAFDRLIDRGVFEDDVRRFAAQFQRASFVRARDCF